jgi:hypothetical protein
MKVKYYQERRNQSQFFTSLLKITSRSINQQLLRTCPNLSHCTHNYTLYRSAKEAEKHGLPTRYEVGVCARMYTVCKDRG